MKKFIPILITLSLLAVACNTAARKEQEAAASLKGMIRAGVEANDAQVDVYPERNKNIEVRVYADTQNGTVCGQTLNITLKPDTQAVKAYNEAHGTEYLPCPDQAYEMLSTNVMLPRYSKSSTSAKVKIYGRGMDSEKTYLLPIVIASVSGSDHWELSPAPVAFIIVRQVWVDPEGGKGTKDEPFYLYTISDMLSMSEKLDDTAKTYFRLMNDIDMMGIPWVPLNFAQPYEYEIDFDGNNHTISNFYCDVPNYASFFGVLYGKCYDLYFKDALIDVDADNACGILGAYCGTKGLPGEARNVHVQGVVKHHGGSKNGIGGLFGRLNEATVIGCSADCEITTNVRYVGGLFGYDAGLSVVSDCCTSGSVRGSQRVGGIMGGLITPGTKIYNCYSTSAVSAAFAVGGIGGHCNQDQKDGNPEVSNPGNVVDKCIAWNEYVHATNQDEDLHYSSGAIIGFTSIKNYLSDCYRRPNLDFEECATCAINVLGDQANSSPASPLAIAVKGEYIYPYHGKAAAAGATVSSIARSLGWSEEIWDFSGDLPVHNIGKTVKPDEPQDSHGQLPDFFEENEIYK